MRQLVYTMFITNNHDSFHLWLKENLVKYQKKSQNIMTNIVDTNTKILMITNLETKILLRFHI